MLYFYSAEVYKSALNTGEVVFRVSGTVQLSSDITGSDIGIEVKRHVISKVYSRNACATDVHLTALNQL